MTRAEMEALADRLRKALPTSQGFALLVFDLGAGGSMNRGGRESGTQ